MTNSYFDTPNWTRLARLTLARAEAVNAIADAIVTGFSLLPTPTQLKNQTVTFVATDTGTPNAIVIALPYTPASYADGMEIVFRPANTVSGATTVNVNGLGVVGLRNYNGLAFTGGEVLVNAIHVARFDLTNNYFRLVNPNVTVTGSVTVNNRVKVREATDTTPSDLETKLAPLGAIKERITAATGDARYQMKLAYDALLTANAQTVIANAITPIDNSSGTLVALNLPAAGAGDTALQDGDLVVLDDHGGNIESVSITITGNAGNINFMGQGAAATLTWNGPKYSMLIFRWNAATSTWIGKGAD